MAVLLLLSPAAVPFHLSSIFADFSLLHLLPLQKSNVDAEPNIDFTLEDLDLKLYKDMTPKDYR